MMISLIAAMGKNRVIGNKNKLPWNLPADMKRFHDITIGKPIIMGYKTFQSIGKPLAGRMNIVMTRDKELHIDGCHVVYSCEQALAAAGEAQEVIVIGGGSVFEQFLPIAQRIYLTIINKDFEGDVLFPLWNTQEWREQEHYDFLPDEKNIYSYTFLILEKI